MSELTRREEEIVELTQKGFSRREVGEMLDIKPNTVKVLVRRAARRRPDLATLWRAANLALSGTSNQPTQE